MRSVAWEPRHKHTRARAPWTPRSGHRVPKSGTQGGQAGVPLFRACCIHFDALHAKCPTSEDSMGSELETRKCSECNHIQINREVEMGRNRLAVPDGRRNVFRGVPFFDRLKGCAVPPACVSGVPPVRPPMPLPVGRATRKAAGVAASQVPAHGTHRTPGRTPSRPQSYPSLAWSAWAPWV